MSNFKNKVLNDILCYAIVRNDLIDVEKCLAIGADINYEAKINGQNCTPLDCSKSKEMVAFLESHGALTANALQERRLVQNQR